MFPGALRLRGTHHPQQPSWATYHHDRYGRKAPNCSHNSLQLSLFSQVEPQGQRDSTVLTIFEVDLSTLGDALVQAPRYRVQQRMSWIGPRQSDLYAQIRAVMEAWNARWLVIDATGLGAGMASFLSKTFPGKVRPFVFT
jgi:hypothetical protein